MHHASAWCLILPARNCSGSLSQTARACRRVIDHVVVFKDSGDDGADGLDDTGIVKLASPPGLHMGQMMRAALSYVREQGGTLLVTVPGEGSFQADDIPRLLDTAGAQAGCIVIGMRRQGASTGTAMARAGRWLSDFWVRVETGMSVRDALSGFRVYPVEFLAACNLAGMSRGFETEILARAAWAGLDILPVEVESGHSVPCPVSGRELFWSTMTHIRLVGRRLNPWPHRRLVKRPEANPLMLLRHPVQFMKGMLVEHATPVELGTAAAVGTFIATLPIFSLHTVVILYVATRLHLNRVMAVAIQNLCMPPFVPFLCVELGYRMRKGCWLSAMTRETWVHQAPERLWEWFLGSLIAAPVIAVVTGLLVFGAAELIKTGVTGWRGPDDGAIRRKP